MFDFLIGIKILVFEQFLVHSCSFRFFVQFDPRSFLFSLFFVGLLRLGKLSHNVGVFLSEVVVDRVGREEKVTVGDFFARKVDEEGVSKVWLEFSKRSEKVAEDCVEVCIGFVVLD